MLDGFQAVVVIGELTDRNEFLVHHYDNKTGGRCQYVYIRR